MFSILHTSYSSIPLEQYFAEREHLTKIHYLSGIMLHPEKKRIPIKYSACSQSLGAQTQSCERCREWYRACYD